MLKFIGKLIYKLTDTRYLEKDILINKHRFWYYRPDENKALWIIKNRPQEINYKDWLTGNIALHYAVEYGSVQIVSDLLVAGADPFFKNNKGFTALDIAEMNQSHKKAELIKSYMDKRKDKQNG